MNDTVLDEPNEPTDKLTRAQTSLALIAMCAKIRSVFDPTHLLTVVFQKLVRGQNKPSFE